MEKKKTSFLGVKFGATLSLISFFTETRATYLMQCLCKTTRAFFEKHKHAIKQNCLN